MSCRAGPGSSTRRSRASTVPPPPSRRPGLPRRPTRSRQGEARMTTLLVLYKAPEGGEDALATFEARYRDEHLPLVAQTPGLRATRLWRVGEALGATTDLVLA